MSPNTAASWCCPTLPARVFPLLLERLNIFTDPQRPMTVTEGIYPINNPDENSRVLVTTNFALTYFIVSGEIEASKCPPGC
jgi:acetyl-CoA decarbonylase/synthase complex subunit gamma